MGERLWESISGEESLYQTDAMTGGGAIRHIRYVILFLSRLCYPSLVCPTIQNYTQCRGNYDN